MLLNVDCFSPQEKKATGNYTNDNNAKIVVIAVSNKTERKLEKAQIAQFTITNYGFREQEGKKGGGGEGGGGGGVLIYTH